MIIINCQKCGYKIPSEYVATKCLRCGNKIEITACSGNCLKCILGKKNSENKNKDNCILTKE